ncbi:MAG TPA: FtsX-like permease family protein, partial [Verrucomicrobiae bacterium]|nr:FtsX-like permease family protein [Verrucomicrobiae bacterium]
YVTIGAGMARGVEEGPRMIVGVVADVRDAGMRHEPAMYVPVAQLSDGMTARNNRLLAMTWVVRTNPGPETSPAAIQGQIRNVTGLPVARVRTLREIVAASSSRTEFYTMLLALFASIALVLAAFGLYGVMAYSVEQRTREIGIRMALGADQGDVRRMVVWEGMRLALLGTLAGVPIALAFSRVMWSMIFGVGVFDPVLLGGVGLLLTAVAMLAALIPSIRATRVDPVDALRA